MAASLGCGNPTALADLAPGEVVLDLGSGGGIDVLLTARRVGPGGRAYGIDMTDEMLDLARSHQAEAGIVNAEFIKGHIEDIPLPNDSVDVVMSNCVINLSPEKDRVLREAYRVLQPGGRLAISDIVFRDEPPSAIREAAGLWGACMGGALAESTYRAKLARAGFADVEVEVTRQYGEELLQAYPELALANADRKDIGLMAAFIRANKPR
jgi:ubiquinone/menaquinone biosynthesis C-methylase UbiE